MANPKSLVLIGSAGSGKTTLVNGLRNPEYHEKVVIPQRFITRPQRLNDDSNENEYIDRETFGDGVKQGRIDPYWERELDSGRVELYGFESVDESDDRLRVYSANNAFLRDRNPSVERVLESGMVVMALAPIPTRMSRLSERSPDMSLDERVVRLADNGDDIMLRSGIPLEFIDTTNLSPNEGQMALRSIVDTALDG